MVKNLNRDCKEEDELKCSNSGCFRLLELFLINAFVWYSFLMYNRDGDST